MKTNRQTKPKAKDSTPEKIGSKSNAEFKEHIRQLNGDKAIVTGASHAHPSLIRTLSDKGFNPVKEAIEFGQPLIKAIVSGRCYDDGFICSLEDALKQFGLSVTSHPSWDGADEVGLIISNRKLTEADLKEEQAEIEEYDLT